MSVPHVDTPVGGSPGRSLAGVSLVSATCTSPMRAWPGSGLACAVWPGTPGRMAPGFHGVAWAAMPCEGIRPGPLRAPGIAGPHRLALTAVAAVRNGLGVKTCRRAVRAAGAAAGRGRLKDLPDGRHGPWPTHIRSRRRLSRCTRPGEVYVGTAGSGPLAATLLRLAAAVRPSVRCRQEGPETDFAQERRLRRCLRSACFASRASVRRSTRFRPFHRRPGAARGRSSRVMQAEAWQFRVRYHKRAAPVLRHRRVEYFSVLT